MAWAWPPYCGAEFHGKVAGHPVVCDREQHPPDVMHHDSLTGFTWWGFRIGPGST